MTGRDIRILEILSTHGRLTVNSLAEMLDVSQVTVRKDLDGLEEVGFIRRIHGHATLEGTDELKRCMVHNYSTKRRIAAAAAQDVKENETIMLESCPCCAFLAEELAMTKKNITIVTNSVFIASYIRNKPNVKIILLGGYYQPEPQITVGSITVKCAETFFLDRFFIGPDGFMPDFGFSGREHMRAVTATELAGLAKETFVLLEAETFHHKGVLHLLRFDKIAGVYTDEGIPKEAESVLLENKVPLHKVSVD